jgi:hypothetical protein
MIRHLFLASAACLAVFAAAPALADVAPFGRCGGSRPEPVPCDVVSMASGGAVCAECADSDQTCINQKQGAGYAPKCSRNDGSSDVGGPVTVYCKGGSASNSRGTTFPLAGVFMLGSVWAGTRLNRRPKPQG